MFEDEQQIHDLIVHYENIYSSLTNPKTQELINILTNPRNINPDTL
jgi:hypothetical protein